MEELYKIKSEIKKIKSRDFILNVSRPSIGVQLSVASFLAGSVSKSQSLQVLGLALITNSVLNLGKKEMINAEIQQNEELYYKQIARLEIFVQNEVCRIMRAIKYEKEPRIRKNMLDTVRFLKKQSIIRQQDKKALWGLAGRKRKGLALGLKKLRCGIKGMTFEEYLEQRENILSYY